MKSKSVSENQIGLIEISFLPSLYELNQIKERLYAEYLKYKSGFYCNWNIIVEQFNSEQMAILKLDHSPIGFVCWAKKYGPLVFIEIVEIAPDFRKRGLGKLLINQVVDHLAKYEYYDISYLQCMPEESLSFWNKLGFIPLPGSDGLDRISHLKYLYKPLKPTLNKTNSKYSGQGDWIQLWNCEPYKAHDNAPMWSWQLKFNSDGTTLQKPILHPSSSDWQIKLILNGKEVYMGKVKRWKSEIDFDCFIAIYSISEHQH